MFQNINADYEAEIKNEKEVKSNKKEIIISKIKEIFKLQYIIYYIICFGASTIGFGENISPFGLALLAATCSNKMPASIV